MPTAVDDGGAIVLQADPTNEIGEVWAQSRDAVLVLAGFAVLSALLMSAVLGRALRSLEILSAAFDHIGKGDYHGSLPAHGPPELTRLANGFNVMTERLATVAAQNHRLNERLLTLQAEERADLARDLHDEIGPMLFAIDMTAAAIERLAGSERETEIPRHVRAIHDSVGRMQRHIRLILERLRPLQTIGLNAAIDRLAAFWRSRRSDIAFSATVSIEDDRICNDLKETIYRVVQEATSNAIRHGRPTRLDITIIHDGAEAICVEVTDDGIGMSADGVTARGSTRLGLIGMRERVMAMAGSLVHQTGAQRERALAGGSAAVRAFAACGRAGMKILLVDDHAVVRSGLRTLLTSAWDARIFEAATGRDALLQLRQERPDLVLLDLNLPGIGGLELLRRMLVEDQSVRILVLSMHAEPLYAARAIELGARGYLSKNASADELLTAIRRITEGRRYIENAIAQELALQKVSPGGGVQDLTERDIEIMRLLAEGLSLTEIADALGIGYKTVANACSHIKAKLGVARTNDLVRLAMTLGIA